MKLERLVQLQTEAYQAYNRLDSESAGTYALTVANCEIALQMAKQNEHLQRIADLLDSFRVNGFPVENIH